MMTPWEAELIQSISADIGWELVEAYSRQMRCLPEEVEKGAEILVEKLKLAGIVPKVHLPEIYLGIPLSAQITGRAISVDAKASALSPSVKNLQASLVHLKAKPSRQGVHPGDPQALFEQRFADADAAKKAVAGRIVLTEGLSNPARTQLLESWGALGVIVINPGDRSHWGTNSTIWGSPVGDQIDLLPKIASVAVSRPEGEKLLEVVREGGSVTLNVDTLHGWFKQPVITTEVRGEGPEADNFILLHSHYDSWEYGVGDNATGNAVVLEVARLLHGLKTPLRRSVRFAWWPGHSAGRYAGSSWFADAYGAELSRHCVAHVNCDSPGCSDATSYASIRSMSEAAPLLRRAVRELFDQECQTTRPGRAGDYSFNNIGITGTMLTSSMVPPEKRARRGWYAVGGCGGSPAWHSEYDTLDVANREVLEKDIRLYGIVVSRLANEERVPLDYRETVLETQNQLAIAGANRLSVTQLAFVDSALSDIQTRLNALYSSQSFNALDFNETLRRVSRHLVRMSYAIGPAHAQDPAKSLNPIPVLSETPELSDDSPQASIERTRALNALQGYLSDLQDLLVPPG